MIISRIGRLALSTALLFAFGSSASVLAQQFVQDLSGFRLDQSRSVTHRELGAPDKQGASDENVAYEAFLLKEDPPLYMVFQYHESNPKLIWSIQISGVDPVYDPSFKDLRLGLPAGEIEKRLGKPSSKQDVGDHGTLWLFAGRNFSLEINLQNRLSSIRIEDDRNKDPDTKNMPRFNDLLAKLQSAQNADLAEIVAPGVAIYDGQKIRLFDWAMKNEIAQDKSGLFATMRRLSKELATVDPAKPGQYEEKLLIHHGPKALEPRHVVRLPKLAGVTEIIFRWNGDKWQIWEFGAKPAAPPPSDWRSIYKPGSLRNIVSERIPALIRQPNVALSKDDGKPLASFSFNSYPTSAVVKFSGESRKTLEATLSLISIWLETLGKPKDLAKRFEYEFKYVEDGVEYWIPSQNPIPERFPKEVKAGDSITIYFSWIGIAYENDKPKVLAIVNEFTPVGK